MPYHDGNTIYILTVQDATGRIIDQELFSERPTFPLEMGTTLRVANLDGGDSVPVDSMEFGHQGRP